MEQYDLVCQRLAQSVTNAYSSSFGLATRTFPPAIRLHIYNIYGLVRVADEIVDTYAGDDRQRRLDALEQETILCLQTGFSANPIVHAFGLSAIKYGIGENLIAPFFSSMRMDVSKQSYSHKEYDAYIHGSAEVVGLMCLKVFVQGDADRYEALAPGAIALGAAFQKVNFLRDLAQDYAQLKRFYFPDTTFLEFDDAQKQKVISDIKQDFVVAKEHIRHLPPSARPAVAAAYRYFFELLQKLDRAPVATIKQHRLRIPNARKLVILSGTTIAHRFNKSV